MVGGQADNLLAYTLSAALACSFYSWCSSFAWLWRALLALPDLGPALPLNSNGAHATAQRCQLPVG